MSLRRRGVAGRRPDPSRPPRPKRAPLPWTRIVGVAGLVAVGATVVWLTSDPVFRVDPGTVQLEGLRYTDPAEVRAKIGLVGSVRAPTVTISTRSMETAIEELPTIASARVRATLPDVLTVAVTEREPILSWRSGDDVWLVDVDGLAFASAERSPEDELGDGASGSTMPAVDDLRTDAVMDLGSRLDPIELEVVRSLATVTPKMVSSQEPELFLSLEDEDGWVLTAPGHWRAVFGHYTQTLEPPSRIPSQVQCLKSLLREREETIDHVTLSVSAERCGSYRTGTPEPTPKPTRRPRPDRTARPEKTPSR
jgi:cell division septal protein FtsQ